MSTRLPQEKYLHLAFEVSLVLKAVFAVGEILAGIGAYFLTQQFLFKLVERITRQELLEDPRDFIANYLFQSAQNFSVSARKFTAVYLLTHGVVKLWLIIGLLRRKLGYYQSQSRFSVCSSSISFTGSVSLTRSGWFSLP
jgi:uncharacterized membrane protein